MSGICPASLSLLYRYEKKGVSRSVREWNVPAHCWVEIAEVKQECVCMCAYRMFVCICVCTCNCFLNLCEAFISIWKPPEGKTVSVLNKYYLWPLWQILIQELCTQKPTPSTWNKQTKRINPSSRGRLTLHWDGFFCFFWQRMRNRVWNILRNFELIKQKRCQWPVC